MLNKAQHLITILKDSVASIQCDSFVVMSESMDYDMKQHRHGCFHWTHFFEPVNAKAYLT